MQLMEDMNSMSYDIHKSFLPEKMFKNKKKIDMCNAFSPILICIWLFFQEESELSSKRWASAPRRSDSPCILGAPTSREVSTFKIFFIHFFIISVGLPINHQFSFFAACFFKWWYLRWIRNSDKRQYVSFDFI